MKSVIKRIGEFFENLWYHYKWLILIIFVVGTLCVVAIVQIIQKGDPDVHVMFIGQNYITADGRTELENTINRLIDDYNGDGRVSLDLVELTVTTVPGESYDYKYQQDALTRFETELRAGMSTVFIVEDSFYKKIIDLGLAAPLTTIFGEGNVPEYANDEYSFRLCDLDIAEEAGFNRFPRESIVCIRHSPENDEINYARTEEDYENNLDFFKKITTYKSDLIFSRPEVGILHADEIALTTLSVYRLDDGVYYTYKEFESTSVASVNYASVQLKKDGNGMPMDSYVNQIEEKLKSGEYGIIFIDTAYLNAVSDRGLISKTSELFPSGINNKGIIDYGVYYNTLEISAISGFCYMNGSTTEENTLVMALASRECFESDEEYDKYKEYYKHLVEFKIPENDVE